MHDLFYLITEHQHGTIFLTISHALQQGALGFINSYWHCACFLFVLVICVILRASLHHTRVNIVQVFISNMDV